MPIVGNELCDEDLSWAHRRVLTGDGSYRSSRNLESGMGMLSFLCLISKAQLKHEIGADCSLGQERAQVSQTG
jgi:hypothetical protein